MLSVFYIVHNEEKLIEKSIMSVKPIADEIIVVDTGSVDKTKQICTKLGCKVYGHPWIHDFSRTRNFALKHCTGNWIMYIDADEILDEQSTIAIKEALDNANSDIAGFKIKIADNEYSLDVVTGQDTSYFKSPQLRIFKNDKTVEFLGRAAETAEKSVAALGNIKVLDAKISHFLWRGKDDGFKLAKMNYYKKLGVMSDVDQFLTGNKIIIPKGTVMTKQSKFPKISVVILTHNRLDRTEECLNCLAKNTEDYELVIVDNASTDGTVAWVERNYPRAKIIKNDKNLGVPIARNQGIKEATADYLVVMDNDVMVQTGWFEPLWTAIRDGADIAGLEAWEMDKNWSPFRKVVLATDRFDYLGGACNIFKRKVFENAGLLDEGFGSAYFEDCDICFRAKKAGFKLVHVPTPRIIHKANSTLVHGQKDFDYKQKLGESYNRFVAIQKGQIKQQIEYLKPLNQRVVAEPKQEQDKPKDNKLRIMYLGMKWDYGEKSRGTSFEHDNFYPSLKQWHRVSDFEHFDFVELGKVHGVDKMSKMLMDRVQGFCPDAIFSVFFDPNHDPRRDVINQIRTYCKTKVFAWFCDSHYRYDTFDKLWAPYVDYCITTSTGALERYSRDGFKNKVIKSQWAASPTYIKKDMQKTYDISFVGQPHGDRRMVIDKIKSSGIPINIFGTGWGELGRRLSFEDMVNVFNQSKINLNLNNACTARQQQIKGRNFEVPACGGFLLSGTTENLGDYYNIGNEIVCYTNTDDMIDKIRYYLKEDAKREKIALAGYNRTISDHTYSKRYDDIFSRI